MKLIRILFLSLVIFFSYLSVVAQQENATKGEANIKEQLKSGVLLVRLSTKENQIKALKANGFEERAMEVEKAQASYNKEIIKAFKDYYNYSHVYFFFSNNSKKVSSNDFNGIFLNEELKADPAISPGIDTFFIAEIGDINTEYSSGSVRGLHLMSADFKQVNCSTFDKFCTIGMFSWKRLRDRTPAELVEILNRRLSE